MNKTQKKNLNRVAQLRKLVLQFVHVATQISVIIIKELHVPLKTLKPVKCGSTAGGERYSSCGILFTLVRDWTNLYGGDSYAIKTAEHELKGTMAYIDCKVRGIFFPLMALIRYRGHAVLARSILPINNSTIVYGSCDEGRTIHNDDANIDEQMKRAAKALNIKGHFVWSNEGKHKCFLSAPVNLEIHKGTDKCFYMVDTARLFPPAANLKKEGRFLKQPHREQKNKHLYQLLRPELVKSNQLPLSSDAGSKLGKDKHQREHDEEVKEATRRLEQIVIPSFASYLDRRYLMLHQRPVSDLGELHLDRSLNSISEAPCAYAFLNV
eukprot:TRINITY_DN14848_c0_g1_i2.p1 TRINITY_DN14848_c0_g1~~TRINITY_DN14848_c0_g1_i2.p1  ORF type:complete len:324 (-),score=42.48 TRINITY_DN14848_c0_g1_i2:2-973(-)